MCGDANLPEDAAQIAFIRAWQHRPEFQLRSVFRNWLFRIAVNAALEILRSERHKENIDHLQLVVTEENVESHFEYQEHIRKIHQAVLALPEASRVVLILKGSELILAIPLAFLGGLEKTYLSSAWTLAYCELNHRPSAGFE